jgi:hypothetical protein
LTTPNPYAPRGGRRIPPGYIIIGCVVAFVLMCCCCAALLLVFQVWGGTDALQKQVSEFTGPTPTPTLDKNAPVPLRTKGVADNGLEMTVLGVQRPLKVEGTVKVPPDQQFILVTVRVRNTKKTGAPIKVTAADFKVRGDGGLDYSANPKVVTIQNLITQGDIPPGGALEGELIFQIAVNDTNLRLNWKTGNQTRVFLLEDKK